MAGAKKTHRRFKEKSGSGKGSPKGATVVDLFCGAGGLSHGFYLEGFDVVGGIDTDEDCRHT